MHIDRYSITERNIGILYNNFMDLSCDLEWDYWSKENFLLDLPKKWLLSFYAEYDGMVIGYCISSEKQNCVWLHHIIIASDMRDKGLGKILLAELESRTKSFTNKNNIRLKVLSKNISSINFYLRNGFVILDSEGDYIIMEKLVKKPVVVAIHQPNYIPWAGYFYKILKSDKFVFLDNVQYTKNSFINRNRIKGPNGTQWLTIPVTIKFGDAINNAIFADDRWAIKHMKTLDGCYSKSLYYESFRPGLQKLYKYTYSNIAELNIKLINEISSWLKLRCEFYLASEITTKSQSDERLIEIVKELNGRIYLSGKGGAKYQDEKKFNESNIDLKYYDFIPPVYSQVWGEFIPGLSILDLLFNVGSENARDILENKEI